MFGKIIVPVVLSLSVCAIAVGQSGEEKPARKKFVTPASSQEVKELKATVAAQQKQIDDLKAIVEKLAAANEKAMGTGQQAADAAEQAQQLAQQAQMAAEVSEKDAQRAEFSAAEAKTIVAKDNEKMAANVESMKKSFSERIKNVGPFSLSGDMRLRDEPFFGGPADESQVRNRMRFRLRFNVNAKLNEDFSGGFTLASGDINNPISVMQTTNQFSTRKPFELDRAFIEYRPRQFKSLTLAGGKISQPWVSTEMVWDKDLNPEGLAQTLNFNLESTPVLKRIALVGFELPFSETAGVSLKNKSIVQTAVYGGQMQTEWRLAEWLKLTASSAFYNWHLADPVALAVATAIASSPDFGLLKLNSNGNQNSVVTTTGTFTATGQKLVTNAQFASKFGLLDSIARFDIKTPAEKWPLTIMGDYVQNTRACANVGNILPVPANTALETFAQSKNAVCDSHQRRGNWLEARAGKSQKKGDLNFAYARIFVEREAALGALNYSEMRQGTNVSQHRVEAFYQLENNVLLGFTGFFGRPLVTPTSPTLENTLKRLQFDVTYKF
jgi:hypothetical protein